MQIPDTSTANDFEITNISTLDKTVGVSAVSLVTEVFTNLEKVSSAFGEDDIVPLSAAECRGGGAIVVFVLNIVEGWKFTQNTEQRRRRKVSEQELGEVRWELKPPARSDLTSHSDMSRSANDVKQS